MKKVELLAPAGNMECLIAAVNGGCNAVYLGLKTFSARAFAGNFSHEEFIEAVSYCHVRGVKVYCTINTMLNETEFENVKKEVAFLYENDCDAILVQDLGLLEYMRTCYPDFPVHCSTQMHIHNLKGVDLMHREGVQRVVMARETPIEIIREACKRGVEIEAFVYGAICISYSGQCLMSSAMKNRSANKGMCAQCCRLRYFKEDGSSFEEGDYILSPKDLNTLDHIEELISSGIASLKIEGRMKRKEYVYLVTKTYREAIDAFERGEKYTVSKERIKQLSSMFNREFSSGHLFHASKQDRLYARRPNHQGIGIGKVIGLKKGMVQVKLNDDLFQHDGLRIINDPHDTGLTAVKIWKGNKLVNHALKNDVVWLECKSRPFPKVGQSLRKTTDVRLVEKIDRLIEEEPVLIPIEITYKAIANTPLVIEVKDHDGHSVNAESEILLQEAMHAPVDRETFSRAFKKRGEYPFFVEKLDGVADRVFVPVKVLNETRRKALHLLSEARKHNRISSSKRAYHCDLSDPCTNPKKIIVQTEKKISYKEEDIMYLKNDQILPVIDEKNAERASYKNTILSSVADLNNNLTNCIAGMSMNVANSYTIAYLLKKGCCGVIFSSELDNEQILSAISAFHKRYGFVPQTYRLVYGKRCLMYIKGKLNIGDDVKFMRDLHGEKFELLYNNGITMIQEPHAYVEKNPYCYGSYVILDQHVKDPEEILEECYEEIY